MCNLAQPASPLDNDSIDITHSKQAGNPNVFGAWIVMNSGDNLFGAGSVLGWNTMFKIAGDVLKSVQLLAGQGEPAAPSVIFTAESKSSVEVCQIIDQVIQWICLVFKGGGDGQTIPLREKTRHLPAPCGMAANIDQP